MTDREFNTICQEFLASPDTLRIYHGLECIFKSGKDVLSPLVEYIALHPLHPQGVLVLDKIVGNAAALLAVKALAGQIYSPLGSELAVDTLNRYAVKYRLDMLVPFILARNGRDMCPMEKLSLGKTPDEFYNEVQRRFLNSEHC